MPYQMRALRKEKSRSLWSRLDVLNLKQTLEDGPQHEVFLFDASKFSRGRSLKTTVPDCIVQNTLAILEVVLNQL